MASVIHESSWEWTLSELTSFRDFQTAPPFSLLPDLDLTFCFKYHYLKIIHTEEETCYDLSVFRLSFVKLQSLGISASANVEINVQVNYLDGSCFRKYETLNRNVQEMKDVHFKDIASKIHGLLGGRFARQIPLHGDKMKCDKLILKCCLKIKDDLLKAKNLVITSLFNFIKDFSSIYEPAVLSDVKIKIGDKYLPAHKAVLAAHSPVFLKMLTNDFQESQTSTINITDTDYEEFKAFLTYLYTGEVKDESWPNVRELYKLADKYDVSTLKKDCQRRILLLMNEDKICDILALLYDHEDKDIKEAVVQYAVSHIKSIIPTEAWKSMVASHLHIGFDIAMKFVPVCL